MKDLGTHDGKLLVSHPTLAQGIFSHSVVLIYQDNGRGSLGLVLNKPAKYLVKHLLEDKGIGYDGLEPVYNGGPMHEQLLTCLHSDDWYCSNTLQIGNGLALSSDIHMLEKIGAGNTPRYWRLFAGVAGWAPGQLDMELSSSRGWVTVSDVNKEIFDIDPNKAWNKFITLGTRQAVSKFME